MTVQLLYNQVVQLPTSDNNVPRVTAKINGMLHIVIVPISGSVTLSLSLNGISGGVGSGGTLSQGIWYDFDGVEVLEGDEIVIFGSSPVTAFLRVYVKSTF